MSLNVAQPLKSFIETEALPGTGVDAAAFWAGLARPSSRDLAPPQRGAAGQARRRCRRRSTPGIARNPAKPIDVRRLRRPSCARSATCCPSPPTSPSPPRNVDPEIAGIAGPQLVVPVTNARYALNAANARWGSLYDALYGTDAIPEADRRRAARATIPTRGAKVIAFARKAARPGRAAAMGASHADAPAYAIDGGALGVDADRTAASVPLRRSGAVRRLHGRAAARRPRVLLRHNGLHLEIVHRPRPSRSARPTRPASPTWCWRRRSPPSRIARTSSPPSMPRTRSTSIATGWA